MNPNATEPVVILVDNRKRDLDVSTLMAFHLRKLGVECHLEPLEAFRAAVAHKPGLVIFNHLFASHLADWSRRLHELGVLTAVLTNEGMLTDESLEYQTGRYHRSGHVDYFFCWNEMHKEGVLRAGTYPGAQVDVIGVPRFDFYFEPWSRIVHEPGNEKRERPQILLCTNAGLAKFWNLPREIGDRHFAQWGNYIEVGDHWKMIEAHWNARGRFTDFATELAKSGKFDIVFRPHPGELPQFYYDWHSRLPAESQARVRIDTESSIGGNILDCDLEMSDESCTTALESWIARKPTLGIVFDRNSPLFFKERADCHVSCDDPSKVVAMAEAQLAAPEQAALQPLRQKHLEKWCASPDGKSAERIATTCAKAIHAKTPADWSSLNFSDYRRAAKLKGYAALGLPYQFDPLLSVKRLVLGKKYAMKQFAYRKSIKPNDVRETRQRFDRILGRSLAS